MTNSIITNHLADTLMSATPTGMKVAIIAIPDRKVTGGEYMAAYGSGETHKQVFNQHVKWGKNTQVSEQTVDGHIIITAYYKGKMGKKIQEEIYLFGEKGFITDLIY